MSLPELLSHAAAVNQILGVPPLLHKLQETLMLKCTVLSPSSSSQGRSTGARRSTAESWQADVAPENSRCKNLSKAEVVEGHTQIHTSILFANVTTSQDCTGKKKSLRKNSVKNVQDRKKLHMPLHLPFAGQLISNDSALAFRTD